MKKHIYLVLIFVVCCIVAQAQTISGILLDKKTGEPMIGATVSVKGTGNGTVTDIDGKFELTITENPPFTLLFSYIGYTNQEVQINTATDLKRSFNIKLDAEEKTLGTVEIVDSRITEKEKQNPLTVESMGLTAIKQTASSTFYEGLGTLKGVDMTTASLGFVVINTRGFNSTSPVRSLQLLDGADNQAPGLSFSVGNFAGASEIDIQKVDLIVGASSPLYGPNAFNGVINLQTKNPFYHNGLSVYVKGAERNLFEGAIRYAQAYKNKNGEDKFAFKLNASYLRADDWQATNMAAATNSWQPATNPGGYDAVNRYGDELPTKNSASFNDFLGRRNSPGLGQIFRSGYEERQVLNYNVRNIKANAAMHYKITDKIEARVAYNFGFGTTVYQGDNRYSINNIQIHQLRAEIIQPDKFYIRAYTTMENSGNSYDAVFTAIKMQQATKSDAQWLTAYSTFWNNGWGGVASPASKVNQLLGSFAPNYDMDPGTPGRQNYWYPASLTGDPAQYDSLRNIAIAGYDSLVNIYSDSLTSLHAMARNFADTINFPGFGKGRLQPGTQQYADSLAAITSRTAFEENGTMFYDRSKMVHVQGEYKFDIKKKTATKNILDLLVGGSFRMYFPDSKGTIFSDTITNYRIRNIGNGSISDVTVNEYNALNKDSFETLSNTRRKLTNWEVGVYLSLNKKFDIDEFNAIILTGTVRFDRNQNFAWKRKDGTWDPIITPAASVVYSYKNNHTIRLSFSSAVRNPTLQDQYLYYNVGRAILIGNLNGVDSLVTVESYQDYLGSSPYNPGLLKWFNVAAIRPEKVRTLELGYKGIFAKKVYIDGSAYISWYKDFLGYQIGAALNSSFNPSDSTTNYSIRQVYRVAANARDRVMTYGVAVGFSYFFINNYSFNGNYSWNKLNKQGSTDPIIPAFNTPEHKFNVGISGKDIKIGNVKGFAFNVNYKWIQGFVFEGSPQFSGSIPSYSLLDAQISYEWAKIFTTFKLGGSNLISKRNYQTYGGPAVGRMIYGSLVVNIDGETLKKGYDKVKTKW